MEFVYTFFSAYIMFQVRNDIVSFELNFLDSINSLFGKLAPWTIICCDMSKEGLTEEDQQTRLASFLFPINSSVRLSFFGESGNIYVAPHSCYTNNDIFLSFFLENSLLFFLNTCVPLSFR